MSAETSKKKPLSEEERRALAEKLDKDIDNFIEELAKKKNDEPKEEKPFNFDEWCKELDQHPAFMKELKPNENGEYPESIQALQALKYDTEGEDAVETAQSHKDEGNKHFKYKKYRWAIDCYTNGIKCFAPDRELNSILYANRAASHKFLGNLRTALRDCIFALKFNPCNYKAFLRGAECLVEMDYPKQALEWIETRVEPIQNFQETEFLTKLATLKEKARQDAVKQDRDMRREKLLASKDRAKKERLLNALKERRLCFKPKVVFEDVEDFEWSQLEVQIPHLKERPIVYLNDSNELVWPLLIQYPESGQTDFLTDCSENSIITELVSQVLENPAEWDPTHRFNLENVRFFLSIDVFDEEQVIEIDSNQTLKSALVSKDFVIAHGLPVIQIYTKKHAEKSFIPIENTSRFCVAK
uniref:Cns1/TTC4 wheel domain-containing protein n=1 Tax=Acrobeloides nanus TaxID=290746 RepID=A0A914DTV2_9BILA